MSAQRQNPYPGTVTTLLLAVPVPWEAPHDDR